MNEAQFSAWLRERMDGHIQRIESGVGSGIPDMSWCCRGYETWVETKVLIPYRGILLRKAQYAWGTRASRHQRRVLVIALRNDIKKILVWRFPLKAEKCGKYLAIVSDPVIRIPTHALTSLFTTLCDSGIIIT